MNPVKITCGLFRNVEDDGGNCPSGQYKGGICSGECADKENFGKFLTLLRQKAGADFHISIATSANPLAASVSYDVPTLDKAIDFWNMMTYDYFVSDIASASITAPNQLLNNIGSVKGFEDPVFKTWSTTDSIQAFIKAGATPSKMVMGIAYYGHTWHVPGIQDDSWQSFGLPAKIEGTCCGPFKQTYGGAPGKGSSACGTMMYSEIIAAGFETFSEPISAAKIGYLKKASGDGATKAGTWVSYLDETSIK